MSDSAKPVIKEFSQSFFHGTKANLKPGDFLTAGNNSNYGSQRSANFVYFTSNLNVAIWGAELALGEGSSRIYVVEPVDAYEDDPNVTNKRFPGNPTRSFRTKGQLRIEAEVTGWIGHTSEEIEARKKSLAELIASGAEIID